MIHHDHSVLEAFKISHSAMTNYRKKVERKLFNNSRGRPTRQFQDQRVSMSKARAKSTQRRTIKHFLADTRLISIQGRGEI